MILFECIEEVKKIKPQVFPFYATLLDYNNVEVDLILLEEDKLGNIHYVCNCHMSRCPGYGKIPKNEINFTLIDSMIGYYIDAKDEYNYHFNKKFKEQIK